jgi:hypothetical protein
VEEQTKEDEGANDAKDAAEAWYCGPHCGTVRLYIVAIVAGAR